MRCCAEGQARRPARQACAIPHRSEPAPAPGSWPIGAPSSRRGGQGWFCLKHGFFAAPQYRLLPRSGVSSWRIPLTAIEQKEDDLDPGNHSGITANKTTNTVRAPLVDEINRMGSK